MADTNWTLVILGTTVGFFALAFLLLFPVYRFLRKEEKVAEKWTPDSIARRQREGRSSGDGAPGPPPEAPTPEAPTPRS